MMSSHVAQAEWLAVLVVWVVVGARFSIAMRRRAGVRTTQADQQAWLLWSVFFAAAMALTSHLSSVHSILAQAYGTWSVDVPQTVISVSAYMLTARVSYSLAPPIAPATHWPRSAGLLAIAANTLLAYRGHPVAAAAVFNAYILTVTVRVVIPALEWSLAHEAQRPMRWRLSLMNLTQAGVVTWMAVGIIEGLSLTVGHRPLPPVVYGAPLTVIVPSFIVGYLMPATLFVRAIRVYEYGRSLGHLLAVRALEAHAALYTQRAVVPLAWPDILRRPGWALYRTTIAVCDARKLLEQAPGGPGAALARRLRILAESDLDADRLVAHLSSIGRGYALAWLLGGAGPEPEPEPVG